MFKVKLALVLSVAAVMAVGSSAAWADDVLTTTFSGATQNLGDGNGSGDDTIPGITLANPPTNPPTACPATDGIENPTGGDGDIGETGCYYFTGSLPVANPPVGPVPASVTCSFADPTDSAEDMIGCSGSIESSGNYLNVVCGTGTATGTALIKLNTSNTGDEYIGINYTILFVGGVGTLTVTGGTHESDGGSGPLGLGITGGGVVDITPVPTTGCVTGPALGFNVIGHVTLYMPDATDPS
jgi:hypothetical protein